jgi:signal transduction histidine kinase
LRAPIALQRALVEVTLSDPHVDAATLREMGERIVASCIRQQRMIDALLDLARCGGGLTRREPVDVAETTAAALLTHDLSEFETTVDLEPARTTGDPDLLERLTANLVANAIRHNIAGGYIEIATRGEAGRAVLSVANTGPVVPARDLRRLFEPFQRLAPRCPDDTEGLGLGLTIVQAIVDAHDALVTATPRRGGGLEVEVSFPEQRVLLSRVPDDEAAESLAPRPVAHGVSAATDADCAGSLEREVLGASIAVESA